MSEEPAIYRVEKKDTEPRDNKITEFEESIHRAALAHDVLLRRLFGYVPAVPGEYVVSREDYKRSMLSVQQDFGLEEGNPNFILFILEQLSRSPRFLKD